MDGNILVMNRVRRGIDGRRLVRWASVLLLSFAVFQQPASAAKAVPQAKPTATSMLSMCRKDLAKRLKIKPEEIRLANMEHQNWPSSALGMPEIGKMYSQVVTPGDKIFFQARNRGYLYVTGRKTFKYAGPLHIWASSMLYVQPIKDEPNFNGDLYQCSLLGTNGIKLCSEVADYYPQAEGAVIVKRRMSRSTHDLLYVKADAPGKETLLSHRMDFHAAALNRDQDQWAAFVRPRLGLYWTVIVGSVKNESAEQKSIPIPEEKTPEKIAWLGEKLIIMVSKEKGNLTAYETDPKEETPVWKPAGLYNFPDYNKFVLNKSENLEVSEIKKNGKPAVNVARVWFTGDRVDVATIPDFAMREVDLLGPYAFISGKKGSKVAVYSVDIYSGDTVASFPGAVSNIKPFECPPHDSLVPPAPKIE